MNKLVPAILWMMLCAITANGQKRNSYIDVAGTAGASQGSAAASYTYNWKIGSKGKFEIGAGARWTSYFGTKRDFISAGPARYTRSFTVPFIIFFAGQKEENFDTLTVQRPLVHSVNAMVNLGYHFNSKWYAGFNIDLIGVSFGRKSSSVFTSNGVTRTDPDSRPSRFNLLLTGDHDKGSLNSEFYVRYQLNSRWSLRAIYQFLFVEYTAQSVSQTYSDGRTNDLFRNKVNNAGLGVSYFLTR